MQIVGIDKSGVNKFKKGKFCHRNEIHTVFFLEWKFISQNNLQIGIQIIFYLQQDSSDYQVITRTKIILKFTTLKIRLPPFNIILLYKIFLFQFLLVILLNHFTILPPPTFPKPLLFSLFKIHNLFFIC